MSHNNLLDGFRLPPSRKGFVTIYMDERGAESQ